LIVRFGEVPEVTASDDSVREMLAAAVRAARPVPAVVDRPELPEGAEEAMQQVLDAAQAPNTRAAWSADWAKWGRWCALHGYEPIPAHPDLVRYYLTMKASEVTPDGKFVYASATLGRWLSTINKLHALAGLSRPGESAVVRDTLRGIRRLRAIPPRQLAPLEPEDLRLVVRRMRSDAAEGTWVQRLRERRDSALLLWGVAGAFRASELVTLHVGDVTFRRTTGLFVTVRQSKTDPDAKGQVKALVLGAHHETCPVCAYWRWRQVLDAHLRGRSAVIKLLRPQEQFDAHVCRGAGLPAWPDADQPLFRRITKAGLVGDGFLTRATLYDVVKRRSRQAELDPELIARLGAHSLRAGFVTATTRAGATTAQIKRQTGHTDDRSVERYVRGLAPDEQNAVQVLGL